MFNKKTAYYQMSEVVIERINTPETWITELDGHYGGLFMDCEWLESISNPDRNTVYLKFLYDNRRVALLGGIETNIRGENMKQLFSFSGISFDTTDHSVIEKSKRALYNYARGKGYKRISLKAYDNHSYIPLKTRFFREYERAEYVFDLQGDKEDIRKRFDPDIRRRARKAKREGVTIRKSNSAELTEHLFGLLEDTYKTRLSKGYGDYVYLFLPFFDREEINKLLKNGYASFYCAEREGEILSIQLIYTCRKRAYGLLMGNTGEGYKTGATALLFYEVTGMFKDAGYLYYNFGGVQRSPNHRGLRKFKDSLGAGIVRSSEEVTNFIGPPLNLLNPLLETKHFLENVRVGPWRVKKMMVNVIDMVIRKRDRP